MGYKRNLTLSFASITVQSGQKLVVFYDNTADIKEISMLNFLGVHLHECCGKREVLKEMNEFLDENNGINITDELMNKKDEIKISLVKELKKQIEKVDYVVINSEWKDFIDYEGVKIIQVSTQ